MATEEFKLVSEELFDNYIELRKKFKEQGFENINLAFKDYLDFYIRYNEVGIEEDFDDDDEDEEDEE